MNNQSLQLVRQPLKFDIFLLLRIMENEHYMFESDTIKGDPSLKNRLEILRKQKGVKQEELAEALEVSRQTIGSLENGRYNPSIILAFKLARYFNTTIEEIFIYEEEKNDKN